jgi:predicted enzyme related to lactoylglutathione lyase
MPHIDTHTAGMPSWVDVVVETSEQREALMAFYGALFGWTFDVGDEAMGYYTIASLDRRAVMGFGQGPGGAGEVTTYFATDDAAASAERVVALGGQVGFGPMDVADVGTMAIVTDPVGARHGLWRPGTFPGFGVMYEPGAPGWFDHTSRDPDAASAYYRDLTGMSLSEPEPGMKVLANGEQWFASVSHDQVPGGRPAQWNAIYVADSLERVRDTVRTLGATVLLEEMPVPGSAITVFAEPVMNGTVTVMRAGSPPDEG